VGALETFPLPGGLATGGAKLLEEVLRRLCDSTPVPAAPN